MSDDLLLQNLSRIEMKIDDVAADVASLKESRAEAIGRFSTIKFLASASGLSAAVSYFTTWLHHQ